MKKSIPIIIAVLLVTAGLYAFVFEWAVPKTASLAVPGKWNKLPLRQPKMIVRDYLGEPVSQNASSGVDEWASGDNKRKYILKIYYVSDTIAAGYSIHYRFKNLLISKDYLIDSFSIR